VIHNCRWQLSLVSGEPRYDDLAALLLFNLLLGLVAVPLALALVPSTKPSQPAAPIDWAALVLGPAGIALAYVGVTQLTWHTWDSPLVSVPVVLGLACLAILVVAETVQHDPLFPIRLLAHPVPALFLGVAIVASTVYSSFLAQLPVFLEQVRGLGEWPAASLFWPVAVGLVPAAALLALTFATRWCQRLVVLGGLCYFAAAWQLDHIDAYTGDMTVLLLAGLIGLGEGTTLFPALITIALSERAATARIASGVIRRLALVQVVRLTLSYVGATPLAHWRGTRATIHYADLTWQVSPNTLSLLADRYMQHGATSAAAHVQALSALVQGIRTQATVLALQDVGALIIVVIIGSSVVLGLVALTATPHVRTVLSRIW
jgi:hypothetical protein